MEHIIRFKSSNWSLFNIFFFVQVDVAWEQYLEIVNLI